MSALPSERVIAISTSTILKAAGIGLALFLAFKLQQLILIVLTAVVIAAAIEPATRWFGRHNVSRLPAVLFVYVASSLVLGGLLFFFIPFLFREVVSIGGTLPAAELLAPVQQSAGALSDFAGDLDFRALARSLETGSLSEGVVRFVSGAFGGILSFVLIVVISFYLAVQERGVENFLRIVSPVNLEPYVIDVWTRTERKIGRWMQGQLLLALIIGPLVYLGLLILGIEYALSLAILAAVFELIPFFGPILAAVPAVLIGFGVSIPKGLMVIGFYVIIQQFENHLIYPLVVKKVIGIPPLVVILALVAGASLAGFLGLVLAIPVAVLMMELLGDLEKKKQLQVSG